MFGFFNLYRIYLRPRINLNPIWSSSGLLENMTTYFGFSPEDFLSNPLWQRTLSLRLLIWFNQFFVLKLHYQVISVWLVIKTNLEMKNKHINTSGYSFRMHITLYMAFLMLLPCHPQVTKLHASKNFK